MDEKNRLAEPFEQNRAHLRGVAFRMLGSLSEAEDAVQETWLRLSRTDTSDVANLAGWLTTVTARVCLDMLRSRKLRSEGPIDAQVAEKIPNTDAVDPEREAELADSVGLALLVVLETLAPAERLAFVLHDPFAMSFDEIAPIVGRSTDAARQLASRARRRVQGEGAVRDADLPKQRQVVDAFLAASRGGDMDALLAILDPEVVLRMDGSASPTGKPTEFRGAQIVAARAAKGGARAARPALVNGSAGVIVAPRGRLLMVLRYTITDGKITAIDAVADPDRVQQLDLSLLD